VRPTDAQLHRLGILNTIVVAPSAESHRMGVVIGFGHEKRRERTETEHARAASALTIYGV